MQILEGWRNRFPNSEPERTVDVVRAMIAQPGERGPEVLEITRAKALSNQGKTFVGGVAESPFLLSELEREIAEEVGLPPTSILIFPKPFYSRSRLSGITQYNMNYYRALLIDGAPLVPNPEEIGGVRFVNKDTRLHAREYPFGEHRVIQRFFKEQRDIERVARYANRRENSDLLRYAYDGETEIFH